MTALAPADDAVPAWVALSKVLDALPRPAPCQTDPEPFTSDDKAERQEAASACVTACLALSACRRFVGAQAEVWHVWGGEDRTPTARGRKARTGVAA